MKLTKKTTLIIGLVGSILILILTFLRSWLFYGNGLCADSYQVEWCGKLSELTKLNYRNLDNVFVGIFPVILFFSLVTMHMKDNVFYAWFKIARVYIPVMVIAMLYASSQSNGGYMNMDAAFNLLFLIIFYLVFFVQSAIKIIKAYRISKTK